ncbi:MAG: exosortase-associated EpsI family protein [Planctomycetota bacterium]
MTTTSRTGSAHLLAAACACALLLASAVVTTVYVSKTGIHLRKLEIMPASGDFVHTLPKEFTTWTSVGTDAVLSKEGVEALGTQNFLTRTYVAQADSAIAREIAGDREPRAIRVQLHLAYYTGLVDTVPHVPERCFVGAGIQLAGNPRNIEIPFDRARLVPDRSVPEGVVEAMDPEGGVLYTARSRKTFGPVRLPPNLDNLAMRVTPFRDDTRRSGLYAGYFFIANGELVPNANQVRLKAFELQDDYAFYMKVQFTSSDVDAPEQLATVAGSMLDEMFADLMLLTPDWVDVRSGRHPAQLADGET